MDLNRNAYKPFLKTSTSRRLVQGVFRLCFWVFVLPSNAHSGLLGLYVSISMSMLLGKLLPALCLIVCLCICKNDCSSNAI